MRPTIVLPMAIMGRTGLWVGYFLARGHGFMGHTVSLATSTTVLTLIMVTMDRFRSAERRNSTISMETKRAMGRATWAIPAMKRAASMRCLDSEAAEAMPLGATARASMQLS